MASDMLYRPPMPAPVAASREPLAIQGKRTQMASKSVVGGFIAQPTNLISARVSSPRQWLITVMQATRGRTGTQPWQFPDGSTGSGNPTSFSGSTLPTFPSSFLSGQAVQMTLRWGAGGASFDTQFDYPVAGGAFGVIADTLDLGVTFRNDPAGTVFTSLDNIPTIGAFMVEGVAADPSPLRWSEKLYSPVLAGYNVANYAVKPWARSVRVVTVQADATAQMTFLDAGNNSLTLQAIPGSAVYEVPVPAGAVALRIIAGAAAGSFSIDWNIGLT